MYLTNRVANAKSRTGQSEAAKFEIVRTIYRENSHWSESEAAKFEIVRTIYRENSHW